MNDFILEYQNAQTDWAWVSGVIISTDTLDGIVFNDDFIVPDLTIKYPFFTWSNFRILCAKNSEKINLWADVHYLPDQKDIQGRTHQSGSATSTYADYETITNAKNSDRFYFWIQATNQSSDFETSQTIYDPMMSKAVTLNNITPTSNIADIENWLGWNPLTIPSGTGIYASNINENSLNKDVARWIVGWDNSCVNILSSVINPDENDYQPAIFDTYRSISGINGLWLGCPENRYIYGKILYSLENHDAPGKLLAGNYTGYYLLNTTGFKSCQISISALEY